MKDWQPKRWLLEGGFAILVLVACVPFWSTDWLPLQDLPQHLAAIRVLHDYEEPALSFWRWFELTPLSTQYVGFYYLTSALAYVMEVETAARVVLTASIAALPYALRFLLRKLERPELLALFAIPAIFNTNLILGFLNFVAALPLMVVGLALAFDLAKEVRWKNVALYVLVAISCFLMHVLPFGILLIGTVLIVAVAPEPRKLPRRLAPIVPVLGLAGLWSALSKAGGSIGGILESVYLHNFAGAAPKASFWTVKTSWERLPSWLLDIVHHPREETVVYVYFAAIAASFVLFGAIRLIRSRGLGNWRLWAPLTLVVAMSWTLYFVLPVGYDWVWPIAPRFALIALLMTLPLIPLVDSKWAQGAVAALLAGVIVAHTGVVYDSFKSFDEKEVGDFDQAVAQLPEGSRVAGLIFGASSRHIRFAPFIHSVAHVQAKKGGAVMFTFADFPQSPFRFRDGHRPPRVPPRWEWTPGKVNPYRDLEWYDYVLIRGGPGKIIGQEAAYKQVYDGNRWSVWQRIRRD